MWDNTFHLCHAMTGIHYRARVIKDRLGLLSANRWRCYQKRRLMCKIPPVTMSEAAVRLRPDDGTFSRLYFSVKSLRLHSHRQVLHKTCASNSHASLPSCSQNMKTREVGLRGEAGEAGLQHPSPKTDGRRRGLFRDSAQPFVARSTLLHHC